jgi:hypothetical protein
MCDIRAANKGEDLEKLFRMTRYGNYNLYLNSTLNSRGVGIAIKKSISHEIKGIVRDVRNENYILLDIVIKGRRLTLGSIYGPNENNVNFYKEIKRLLGLWKNNFFIIGGDFNTILDMDRTADNLDRIGAGRIPNKSNGEFINEWIREGSVAEPFRALYPEEREISYLSYRAMVGGGGGQDITKSRLDFFLVSTELLGIIRSVVYEDRLSMDFDHKEVTLTIGMKPQGGKITVYNDTLLDPITEYMGILAYYDCLNAHLVEGDPALARDIGQLDILIRGIELNRLLSVTAAGGQEIEENIRAGVESINIMLTRLSDYNILDREFSCNYRSLYEVLTIKLKNS